MSLGSHGSANPPVSVSLPDSKGAVFPKVCALEPKSHQPFPGRFCGRTAFGTVARRTLLSQRPTGASVEGTILPQGAPRPALNPVLPKLSYPCSLPHVISRKFLPKIFGERGTLSKQSLQPKAFPPTLWTSVSSSAG